MNRERIQNVLNLLTAEVEIGRDPIRMEAWQTVNPGAVGRRR